MGLGSKIPTLRFLVRGNSCALDEHCEYELQASVKPCIQEFNRQDTYSTPGELLKYPAYKDMSDCSTTLVTSLAKVV